MIIDVSISLAETIWTDGRQGGPLTVFWTRQPGLLIHRRQSAHKQRWENEKGGEENLEVLYLLQQTGSIPNLRDLPHQEISDVLLVLEEWDTHVICRNVASAANQHPRDACLKSQIRHRPEAEQEPEPTSLAWLVATGESRLPLLLFRDRGFLASLRGQPICVLGEPI